MVERCRCGTFKLVIMNIIFTSLILLFAFVAQSIAKPGPRAECGKKIEALYIAYITRELKLTEQEAQKFWPVHNEYDKEVKAIKPETSELARQQNVLNIKKKYEPRITAIIGAERTNDFFKKDAEF